MIFSEWHTMRTSTFVFEPFQMTQRIEHFLNMTHRIELIFSIWLKRIGTLWEFVTPKISTFLFSYDSKHFFVKELNLFFLELSLDLTQRIEHSFWNKTWLKELNLLFEYDSELRIFSKHWTVFFNMTQQNWIGSFSKNLARRLEPSSRKWLREFNLFWRLYDSKMICKNIFVTRENWTLLWTWTHRNWDLFWHYITQRINCFFYQKIDSQN